MADPVLWTPQRPPIFFMHLPKTAGMALRLYLGNQYPASEILPADDWRELLTVNMAEIRNHRLFQGHFTPGFLDLLPTDVLPIVFLREPIARTISHLKHLRRDPEFHPAHPLAAGRSLDDLVRDDHIMKLCCEVQSALLCNYIPGETILAGLRRDVSEGRPPNADAFAVPPDLETAEASLDHFAFVGFVEDLQQDILRLSLEFGLHPPQPLPKRNFDPEGSEQTAGIAPDTLAILRERNAIDIALYDAARRRFAGRSRATRPEVGAELLARGIYSPIRAPVTLAMTGPIPGSNWYPCEESAGGGHRWTGPLNETTLELPLAEGLDYEVSLFLRAPSLDELTIFTGRTRLPPQLVSTQGAMQRIAFRLPAKAVKADDLTPIRFRTKNVSQASAADLRLLSFLVREITVSPAAPTA